MEAEARAEAKAVVEEMQADERVKGVEREEGVIKETVSRAKKNATKTKIEEGNTPTQAMKTPLQS